MLTVERLDYFIRKNQYILSTVNTTKNKIVYIEPVIKIKEKKCWKCNQVGKDKHHITYIPEFLSVLCEVCHKEITYLNWLMSTYWQRSLTNLDRLKVYVQFLQEPKFKYEAKAVLFWENL